MKLLLTLNPENVSEKELINYPLREAARAVILDIKGNIALLHVKKSEHFKIPGGGIEKGENRIFALKRECKEEAGVVIEVIAEIGYIVEYRKMNQLKQVSYCYLAKTKGKKGKPEFMQDEIESGFEVVWLPYQTALKKISENSGTTAESVLYMVPRDTFFLKEAKKHIDLRVSMLQSSS